MSSDAVGLSIITMKTKDWFDDVLHQRRITGVFIVKQPPLAMEMCLMLLRQNQVHGQHNALKFLALSDWRPNEVHSLSKITDFSEFGKIWDNVRGLVVFRH